MWLIIAMDRTAGRPSHDLSLTSAAMRAVVEKMMEGGFDQLPVFERRELVGAIVHLTLLGRIDGRIGAIVTRADVLA